MYQNMAGYNDLTIYDNQMIHIYEQKILGARCLCIILQILTGIDLALWIGLALMVEDIITLLALVLRVGIYTF